MNLDDPETRAIADVDPAPTTGSATASTARAPTSWARTCSSGAEGASFALEAEGERVEVQLRCPDATMRRMRSQRSQRRARSACRRRTRRRRSAASRVCGGGWRPSAARRRHRDRRFRAQSRQDRRDAGDPSRASRPPADHVPAARLWAADEDGRGTRGGDRGRDGAGRPAVPARPGLSRRHGGTDARIGLARRRK